MQRRNCLNCTCLPGLLSRQRRLLAVLSRRLLERKHLSGGRSRAGSIYSFSTCAAKEAAERNTLARLAAVRKQMLAHNLTAYIIPSGDFHASEYTHAKDLRREFVLGFTGLAGVAIVTVAPNDFGEEPSGAAGLATDGRYFSQATDELDFNWTLIKQGSDVPWVEWAAAQAAASARDAGVAATIGVDPRVISLSQVASLKTAAEAEGVAVKPVEGLVDSIWGDFEETPAFPNGEIFLSELAKESVATKLQRIRSKMTAPAYVVPALDDVAWTLNLRGSDIPYTPLFFAFLTITTTDATLYTDSSRFGEGVAAHLEAAGVTVLPYADFFPALKALPKANVPDTASWAIHDAVATTVVAPSFITALKAVKSEEELAGARAAHHRDGVAIVRFLAWLEAQLAAGAYIDECTASDRLLAMRRLQPGFVLPSFATIAASGANSAVVHYQPRKELCRSIDPAKMFLCDLGGQYTDGTTDTTRCVHFGEPSAKERTAYTLVLKGNLALERQRFPAGTSGLQLDALARQFLWQQGLDYAHGTGHGVGAFGCVHEGPVGIAPRPSAMAVLEAGNVILNEPGLYYDGDFGVRIENVVVVVAGERGLEFENVTRVPYCRRLIDVEMLTAEEVEQVDSYHRAVWVGMRGELDGEAREWLERETSPL